MKLRRCSSGSTMSLMEFVGKAQVRGSPKRPRTRAPSRFQSRWLIVAPDHVCRTLDRLRRPRHSNLRGLRQLHLIVGGPHSGAQPAQHLTARSRSHVLGSPLEMAKDSGSPRALHSGQIVEEGPTMRRLLQRLALGVSILMTPGCCLLWDYTNGEHSRAPGPPGVAGHGRGGADRRGHEPTRPTAFPAPLAINDR